MVQTKDAGSKYCSGSQEREDRKVNHGETGNINEYIIYASLREKE